jgi:hypothetical protein
MSVSLRGQNGKRLRITVDGLDRRQEQGVAEQVGEILELKSAPELGRCLPGSICKKRRTRLGATG